MACSALVEHELTGVETYYGLTPYDTRSTPEEIMTLGWFTGMIPVTVPASTSFAEAARAAQASFDAGMELANVPVLPGLGVSAVAELASAELPRGELLRFGRRSAVGLSHRRSGRPDIGCTATEGIHTRCRYS